jgi:hypothetical protein
MTTLYVSGATSDPFDASIARVALRQCGIITRAQAITAGGSRRMIDWRISQGRWDVVHKGIYRLVGTEPTWMQKLVVVSFAGGDGTVVSHRASAAQLQFPDFAKDIVEVTMPRVRRRARPADSIVHHADVPGMDTFRQGPLRFTNAARTIIDLAAVVPQDLVELALDDALNRNMLSLRWINRRLTALSPRPGVTMLRALLKDRDDGQATPRSVMERKFLRIFREAGLPEPVRQYPIYDDEGLIGVADFAYPEFGIVIEALGFKWHGRRERWERDIGRRNRMHALGHVVLEATSKDLWDPTRFIATVRHMLGWKQLPLSGSAGVQEA